jgi:hypothetical protein
MDRIIMIMNNLSTVECATVSINVGQCAKRRCQGTLMNATMPYQLIMHLESLPTVGGIAFESWP